jgi:hypothetical protein
VCLPQFSIYSTLSFVFPLSSTLAFPCPLSPPLQNNTISHPPPPHFRADGKENSDLAGLGDSSSSNRLSPQSHSLTSSVLHPSAFHTEAPARADPLDEESRNAGALLSPTLTSATFPFPIQPALTYKDHLVCIQAPWPQHGNQGSPLTLPQALDDAAAAFLFIIQAQRVSQQQLYASVLRRPPRFLLHPSPPLPCRNAAYVRIRLSASALSRTRPAPATFIARRLARKAGAYTAAARVNCRLAEGIVLYVCSRHRRKVMVRKKMHAAAIH